MQLTWKPVTERFENGERLFVGPYQVGSVHWSPAMRSDSKPYVIHIGLPGIRIKDEFQRHADIAVAKATLEQAVKNWFKRTTADVDTTSPRT